MASKFVSCDHADDDYIDMEVSSYSNFFCHSANSHSQPREFEFQMASIVQEKEPTTSPADELFYKGKLLPLHLPPRLQMVEKILQNSTNTPFDMEKDVFEEFYSTPLNTTTYPSPITGTPFESCNISPNESCQVSRELSPEEYYNLEYQTDNASGFVVENQKKSWTKKLKQSSLGSKLKASRAYLKSLFGKSGCSYESYAASTKVADECSVSKARGNLNKHVQVVAKKNPYGQIHRDKYMPSNSVMRSYKEKNNDYGSNQHRRSFSVGIKLFSGNKSSTSSSSSGSTSFSVSNKSYECQFLKRCSSASSEIENSIQGAIAHCKKSQQMFSSKKNASEVGFYSLSASRNSVCEDQEREDLCRG
ncbi:PREDICTED: probable membrane-associated kinase regulator 4 [Lupinus angustifolius]|uniref:probable membrane-associated kinase regulator 4 n=1 Tax=Lupinus angustifolius TaxID=3871 RepID=UPI00092F02B4|nr:PREDICTED: probable membrane-associated kinase regulator 4 [Lupinus angustifolius]